MWFIGVEVEQETSVPPPKKILDPPLCLVAFQNRRSAPIGRDENFVNFEFPKDNFVKKSLALSAKRKLRITLSIELCLPICVS